MGTVRETEPNNLSYWQSLSASQAASEWMRRLERTPPAIRKAAIAWADSRAGLQANFDQAEGPLRGIPFAIKDLFDLTGVRTLAGSRVLAEIGQPASQDALLVKKIRGLGGVPSAKTHLHEFAYGLTGRNPHYGDVPHPLFPDRLAGGSSSGSAWAVAAGLVPLALGTDTAGSIRVPAAFCGIHGMRWSQNGWEKSGVLPLAPSYDSAGWFTRSAQDMVTVTEALAGPISDRTLRGAVLPMEELVRDPILRGALEKQWREWGLSVIPEETQELHGNFIGAAEAYSVLSSREALAGHTAWLDRYRDLYDPAVWPLIDRARRWSDEQVRTAQVTRQRIGLAWSNFFRKFDFLVMPAAHAVAPTRGDLDETFRPALLALTTPASLASLPALCVPVALPGGLSGGLQIVFSSDRPQDAVVFLRRFAHSQKH